MRERKDFIELVLTQAGEIHVKGGLRTVTAHMHYYFTPGKPVEVLRGHESKRLLALRDGEGEPLLEEFIASPVATAVVADTSEES